MEDRVSFECTKDFKKRLVLYCAENEVTLKDFCTNLIEEKIK